MGLLENYRLSKAERKRLENEDKAVSLFQVKENGGELWFTYDGWLVCLCSMLKDEPVEAIRKMRELYIERSKQ